MGVESQAAIEAVKLLTRDPGKYGSLVAGLYLLSLRDREQGKLLRSSYLFFRHVDDFLDESDGTEDGKKLPYVLNLRDQIENNNFTRALKVSDLAEYALNALEKRARPNDSPRQDFLDGIDAIIFDYQRAKERRVLTSEELNKYYHDAFFPVVNLMLIGFESQFRADDIPALSYCQGRIFSIRDLEEDWKRGVINVPKEILDKAELTGESSIEDVKKSAAVSNWIRSELLKSKPELIAVKNRLQSSGEKIIPRACNGVIKTMEGLFAKYSVES